MHFYLYENGLPCHIKCDTFLLLNTIPCCWRSYKGYLNGIIRAFYLYLQNFVSDQLEALKSSISQNMGHIIETYNNTSHLYFILLFFFYFLFPFTNSFPHPTVLCETFGRRNVGCTMTATTSLSLDSRIQFAHTQTFNKIQRRGLWSIVIAMLLYVLSNVKENVDSCPFYFGI